MKIKYYLSVALSLLLFTACSTDDTIGSLANINVDKTFLSIPETGGEATITVNATEAWAFDKTFKLTSKDATGKDVTTYAELPTWLTATTLTGAAGETKVTFRADKTNSGREAALRISIGDKLQFINVRQGSMTPSLATCQQVNAGIDGKNYRVKGAVTVIENTTYGNLYINDGTGDLYVYGVLDQDGAAKNFAKLGIEVGDVIEIEGPRTVYSGKAQLKNVMVNSITKSLLKLISPEVQAPKEKSTISVKVAYKGNGAFITIPENAQSWISSVDTKHYKGVATYQEPNPADTAEFKLNVAANEGNEREAVLEFKSYSGSNVSTVTYTVKQEGAIATLSIADFMKLEKGKTCRLNAYISSIKDEAKGNFYIKDFSGETYVYGMSDFKSKGLKAGDIVTIVGTRDDYKGSIQMTKAKIEDSKSVKKVTAAEFIKLADDKNTFYMLTGTVAKPAVAANKFDLQTYGNFDLVDASGRAYIYGVSTGWGGETKKFGTLNIKEGDEITIYAYKTSYKNNPQGVGYFISKK